MKKVLKGILHIVACYALLTVAQPLAYRLAAFIGAWATTGWFVSITYGVGLAICYGIFTAICILITEKIGAKASTIISAILCATQIVYGQVMAVKYEWFFDNSTAFTITSWIAVIMAVIMQILVLLSVPAKPYDEKDNKYSNESE